MLTQLDKVPQGKGTLKFKHKAHGLKQFVGSTNSRDARKIRKNRFMYFLRRTGDGATPFEHATSPVEFFQGKKVQESFSASTL